jgi:hypothetical protein
VTHPLSERSRAIVAEELGGAAAAVYLADLAPPERAAESRGRRALGLVHDAEPLAHLDETPPVAASASVSNSNLRAISVRPTGTSRSTPSVSRASQWSSAMTRSAASRP